MTTYFIIKQFITPTCYIFNAMKIDIVKYRWFWIGFSLAVLIPGFIAIGMCFVKYGAPVKLGLDFTGGTKLEYKFSQKLELEKVREILDKHKLGGSNIQLSKVSEDGSQVLIIRSRAIKERKSTQKKASQKELLDNDLRNVFGQFEIFISPRLRNIQLTAPFSASLPWYFEK